MADHEAASVSYPLPVDIEVLAERQLDGAFAFNELLNSIVLSGALISPPVLYSATMPTSFDGNSSGWNVATASKLFALTMAARISLDGLLSGAGGFGGPPLPGSRLPPTSPDAISTFFRRFCLLSCGRDEAHISARSLCMIPLMGMPEEYFVTAPGYLTPNATSSSQAVVRNPPSAGQLVVELWGTRSGINQNSTCPGYTNLCIDSELRFGVPELNPSEFYNMYLHVTGQFGSSQFHNKSFVQLEYVNNINVIVQTDKPMYRQGSTVNYRILLVDNELLPVTDQLANITITNPYGQLLFQQQFVNFSDGLLQNSYKLLDITDEGIWTIAVSAGTNSGSTSFEVRDYVLPKFSVTITPDGNDVVTNPTVLYTVCAKYTYGESVKGTVQIYTSPFNYYYPVRQKPVILRVAEINGCYDYVFNVSLLNTVNYTYPTYPSINVTAKVIEAGTGVSLSATELHSRGTTRLRLNFGQKYSPNGQYTSTENTFKLNLLNKGQVSKPTRHPSKAVLFFQAIAVNYPRIIIKNGPTLEKPTTQQNLVPFYSPTASSIRIDRGDDSVYTCQASFVRDIVMTADANVDYQLFITLNSAGRILETRNFTKRFTEAEITMVQTDDNLIKNDDAPPDSSGPQITEPATTRSVGSFQFKSTLPPNASPKVQLLVYYVHRDSNGNPIEVVSDSAEFSVQKCLENNVTLTFDPKKALPGSNVSLSIDAAGNSLCGVGAVDSSVTLLDGYNRRNSRDALLSQISNLNYRYTHTSLVNQSYCYVDGQLYNELYEASSSGQTKVPRRRRQAVSPSVSFSYDSLTSFENSGLVIFTNLPVQTRPCPNRAFPGYPNNQVLGQVNRFFPTFGAAANKVAFRPNANGAAGFAAASPIAESAADDFTGGAIQGTNSVRTLFPETWLWQIRTVSASGSLVYEETIPDTITTWQGTAVCLHPKNGLGISQVANVTGFQPLFASLTLPAYMQRNEVATIILTAFNYGDVCVVVRVSLTLLENWEIVSGPNSTDALLCPNATNSASFPFDVRATTLELSRLQARVQTRPEAQSEYPDVKLSNVNSSDTVIQTIDVRPEGFSIRTIDTYLLCASGDQNTAPDTVQVTLPTPEALVEGSQRVVLVGTGDILALSLNDLSVPPITYSNAEGTLAVLASSVYLLKYLEQTGTLTDTVNSGLRSRIQQASQAQYSFRSSDGSYASFGSNEYPRSIFLTAFAVKALSAAKEYLGANAAAEIDASVRYVTQQWNPLTGCFVENEPTASPYGPNTTPDLNAAVGVMLAESGLFNDSITEGVLRCIDANNLPSNHTTALNAYFSALVNRPERANTALQTLLGEADKSSGLTSWTGDGLASGSADTAGYAVLTSKLLGRNLGEALPIVRWLMQQTYARYTFSYSEVYTVAIQALTQYSSVAFSKNTDLSLTVAVESASPDNLSFQINEQNKLLYQERLLDKSDSYSLQASLTPNSVGCAALQVKYYYNSRNSPLQRGIQVNASATSGPDCSTLQLDICTRYTEGFLRSSAIVEVTMLSGYSADDQSLKNLVSSGVIKRYVVNGNKVQLVLQTLTIQPTCFSFTENRYLQVTNLQSSVVEVYDYYQYQYKATAGYGLEGNCTPAEVAPPTSLNEVDSVIYV
nr:LOW QUALITY PROTEIN: alpha-2-macroglobulin-like [Rhipicephalus microplus]